MNKDDELDELLNNITDKMNNSIKQLDRIIEKEDNLIKDFEEIREILED